MVTIAAPNVLHHQMTPDCFRAGKHVVCEKPLCMTLEEADEMIDVCRQQGVLLMYAEEPVYPHYVRAKQQELVPLAGFIWSSSARSILVRMETGSGM